MTRSIPESAKRIISAILVTVMTAALLGAVLPQSVSADDSDLINIVLDPGHGGNDPGAVSGERYESDYNYQVASLIAEKLNATGKFRVTMTRSSSEGKTLLERALVADSVSADMLISLHFNSSEDTSLCGTEILCSVLDEWCPLQLANSLLSAVTSAGFPARKVIRKVDTGDSRGVYYWNEEAQWDIPGVYQNRISDYYGVPSWGAKFGYPALIVEHCYLSSASDRAVLARSDTMDKMATAEADAIIKYFTAHTHSYSEQSCDRPASCCLQGVYSEKCIYCGHRRNVTKTPVDPDAHMWVTESSTATCTADGYVNRICHISRNLSEKGYNVSVHEESETIPASGHSYQVTEQREASHGVDGYKKEVCSLCGDVIETVTPGDPHVYTLTDSAAPTCEEAGYNTYVCSVCGDTYTDEIPAAGHDTEITEKKEPTCTEAGSVSYKCKVCGKESTEELPAAGHDFVLKNGEIDCSSSGTEEFVCSRCGETKTDTVEVPEHSFEVKERKTDENGNETVIYVCSVCGVEKTETVTSVNEQEGGSQASYVIFYIVGGAVIAAGAVAAVLFIIRKKKNSTQP